MLILSTGHMKAEVRDTPRHRQAQLQSLAEPAGVREETELDQTSSTTQLQARTDSGVRKSSAPFFNSVTLATSGNTRLKSLKPIKVKAFHLPRLQP